jgi:putative ABC transport system permease protein
LTFLAILLGFVIFETLLPLFNNLVGRMLDFRYLENYRLLLLIITTGLLTGLLSGAFPAWLISRSDPGAFLKSQVSMGPRHPGLRKTLIAFQFLVSAILIIGMLQMARQTRFMTHKDLGFSPEGVVRVPFDDSTNVRALRLQAIMSTYPEITGSTIHDYPVCASSNWTTVSWEGAQDDQYIRMNVNYADHGFTDLYGIRIRDGKGFLAEQLGTGPEGNKVLINQAAVETMALQDPVGKTLHYYLDYKDTLSGGEATIVGVMEDFHFLSVHNLIQPFMLRLFNEEQHGWSVSFRYKSADVSGVVEHLSEAFGQVFPEQVFEYAFVDEFHNQMYQEERKMSRIILWIALLANLIAALGLYGQIAYSTSIRTREVGLRKVLGAGFLQISGLFFREFLLLVLLANLGAWPLIFFAGRAWLRSFPYQAGFALWPYLTALALSLVIAMGSMLYHTYRSSRMNPTDSLRYE